MLVWFNWFIIGIITILVDTYLYTKFSENKYPKINLKFIAIILIVALINSISASIFSLETRIVFNFLIYIFYFKLVFKDTYSKIAITQIFLYILLNVLEPLFYLVITGCFQISHEKLFSSYLSIFIINMLFMVVEIIVVEIKGISNAVKSTISWFDGKKVLNILVLIAIIIYSMFNVLIKNASTITSFETFIINNSVLVILMLFIIVFMKEKSTNNRLASEYEKLLEYTKIYEDLIEKYRKNVHEFKNQLIIVKDMANSKKVTSYISGLLEDEDFDENSQYLERIKYLPNGGLKGFIYYKIKKMQESNINNYIDINSSMTNKKVVNYCNNYLKDISKVLGVFLDNAIEACREIDDKSISFEAKYENDKIYFIVSNTFVGNIDFATIDDEGYTTKGNGKGYGLSLVREIIKKNKNFINEREINSKFFVQKLIIDIKNKFILNLFFN